MVIVTKARSYVHADEDMPHGQGCEFRTSASAPRRELGTKAVESRNSPTVDSSLRSE
jgi:hypothetical protein